jgi:hypothetical protein
MNTGFEAIELPSTTNAPMIGSSSPPKWARGADVPDMPIPRGPIAILTETDPTRGPLGIMLDNSGVNPKMSSGYKSTVGSKLPESSFSNWGVVSEANKGTKAMAGGLKSETEAAVGRALGPKAQADLAKKNDALGRLITTQEKQALEAAKEANKNYFTSVDGMIVGAHNPEMLAAKKVADALKATAIRTYGGRAMMDFGKSGWADPIVRRALLDRGVEESQPSPWGP